MLPYSVEAFFALVSDYNLAIRPLPALALFFAAGVLALAVRSQQNRGRLICGILAAGWAWTGIATAGAGISFDNTKFISLKDHVEFVKRTDPERDDILISKDGTLGVVRRVQTDRAFSLFVSVALLKPIDRRLSPYLEYAFQSPQLQAQMIGVGIGLQHIHLTDLRKDLIPVAPPAEQDEIVRRIAASFARVDRLTSEAEKALNLVGRLD